jgi:hypothetical protein
MTNWVIEQPDRITIDGEVKSLEVALISGRLNVVATDGPPRVEVAAVGRRHVLVRHEDGVLKVSHERPGRWPGVLSWLGQFVGWHRVDVSVAVPHAVGGELSMVSGSVVASGLAGGARVDVTSGRITLLGLDGHTTAKVISGSIEALHVDGDLSLETVSGEITLADSAATRVRARTISGSITCDLDNPAGSEIRLDTTSGEITVRVREDSDLDVQLHAVSGRVASAFGELPKTAGNSLRGTLGAGTGRLYVNAVSGTISLLRRPAETS